MGYHSHHGWLQFQVSMDAGFLDGAMQIAGCQHLEVDWADARRSCELLRTHIVGFPHLLAGLTGGCTMVVQSLGVQGPSSAKLRLC